jgi:hypothetical protein
MVRLVDPVAPVDAPLREGLPVALSCRTSALDAAAACAKWARYQQNWEGMKQTTPIMSGG